MPRRIEFQANGDHVPPLFPPGDHRKTVNVKQLSELTGVPTFTLRDWSRRGLIAGMFQPRKHGKILYRLELLERWWAQQFSR
jgi:phage terminase Nu1 subunit (DNA packaging protein)